MESETKSKSEISTEDKEALLRELREAIRQIPLLLQTLLCRPLCAIRNSSFGLLTLGLAFIALHSCSSLVQFIWIHFFFPGILGFWDVSRMAAGPVHIFISMILISACLSIYLLHRQGSLRILEVARLVVTANLVTFLYLSPFTWLQMMYLSTPVLYLSCLVNLLLQGWLLFEGLCDQMQVPAQEALLVSTTLCLLFYGLAA